MSPGPAALLLGAAGTAALLSDRIWAVAVLTLVLLAVCLRAPSDRRRVYLFGALSTGLGVLVQGGAFSGLGVGAEHPQPAGHGCPLSWSGEVPWSAP